MNVKFLNSLSTSFIHIKDQILQNTNPLQRKITAIVLCIFTVTYLMIRFCGKGKFKNNAQHIQNAQNASGQIRKQVQKYLPTNKSYVSKDDLAKLTQKLSEELEDTDSTKTQKETEVELEDASTERNQYSQLIEKDKKYYFIAKDNKSYLLKTLVNIALNDFQAKKEKMLERNSTSANQKHSFSLKIRSPERNKYEDIYCWRTNEVDTIASRIIEQIQTRSIVDWARTSNQMTCPLSLEDFDKPYILNMNGRTYSKEFITQAIKESLYKDESLRLEDMTLQPSMIERIILLPNLSLQELSLWKNKPKEITFSAANIQVKDFNEQEARIKNINGFSEFIRDLPPIIDGLLDAEKLYNYYADARGIAQITKTIGNRDIYTTVDKCIENLVIQNIKFPSSHPKGGLIFNNILFEKCQIIMKCWCGLRVKSSKFVDCTIDLKKFSGRPIVLKRTKLVNCKIIVDNDLTPKGSYNNIENIPHILDHIFNIVENVSDVENCTLESV